MAKGISLHIGVNEVDPAHYDGRDGVDGMDESWALYDRQLVGDELHTLYAKFNRHTNRPNRLRLMPPCC